MKSEEITAKPQSAEFCEKGDSEEHYISDDQDMSCRKTLAVSILSLSLLTVMAGAAVAPALGVIQEYFADSSPVLVQMIISVPAIFIVITNAVFPKLCQKFGARTLTIIGLLLYTAGGCIAGAFSQIVLVLIMRAFVGIGVGIVMPLSTGLLSFYFPPERQAKLMGYSSAMNQMGGVVATLLSGVLAGISWRLSFLVYLMGLISIVLCMIFVPNDKIHGRAESAAGGGEVEESADCEKPTYGEERGFGEADDRRGSEDRGKSAKSGAPTGKSIFRQNYVYIIAMFLLMTTFFLYPANFAMETVQDSVIPAKYIAAIMAGADLIAFFGGLLFVVLKKLCGRFAKFLAPLLFLAGYLLLLFVGGWFGVLAGSACIGFANGVGIPFIIFEASVRAGKAAATTVMPLISAALYLAQFLCPILMSIVRMLFGSGVTHLPYCFAVVLAVFLCFWSVLIPSERATR